MGLRRGAADRAREGRGRVLRHASLIRLAALALLIGGAFAAVSATGHLSAGRVRDWVDGYGVAGPLVFIAVSACLTVALFPGPLLAGASGLLFGTALGTPVSIVAATLGATLAFSLARWIARDAVDDLVGGAARGRGSPAPCGERNGFAAAGVAARVQAIRAWIGERGFLSVLYARLAPGIPYTLVNYAAGLAPIRLRDFVLATAIGCAPRAFAYTALGGSLSNLRQPEAIVAIVVLVVMAVVGLVLGRRHALRPSAPGTGSSSPAGRSAAPR